MSPSELTNSLQLNSSLCTFIGMKHISPTFMYIIPMYLRLTTFTKTLPQMSFHLSFCYFYFAPPMTLLTAGALTDYRLPAAASNVCTTDARLGGVGQVPPPPKQKSWLGGVYHMSKVFHFLRLRNNITIYNEGRAKTVLLLEIYIILHVPSYEPRTHKVIQICSCTSPRCFQVLDHFRQS